MSATIKPFTDEFEEYGRDESRSSSEASSISFPTSEGEACAILRQLHAERVSVTVQGARTGLAAGAVPHGGHILNTSRMNRYLGLRRDDEGHFLLRVEPGVVLSELRKQLGKKMLPTAGWDQASLKAYEEFQEAPEQFFPTDPTEASACLGGMAACNASGARSYAYGPMRPHITGLHVALTDGDLVELQRGEVFARGRHLSLATAEGRALELDLPGYIMPETKNASGYFVADDMDAIDLFIGACGTLGVITELEIALQAAPAVVWGVSCFFDSEDKAVSFTDSVRPVLSHAAAIEYFDAGALDILRRQREQSTAFSSLPALDKEAKVCVYVELDCDDEAQATEELYHLGWVLELAGGRDDATWVARTEVDRECQRFFRHAVPESVNMLIDERRRTDPTITKLGSDMSVPNARLADVIALYRRTLAESGLESAAWGHIGNNHLHVNILPRDAQDYRRGGELFAQWASEVTAMGGAVSAEHGVGKIKAVPGSTEVKMDPKTNTIVRDGKQAVINPFDASALECALALKDDFIGFGMDVRVTVVSMGIPATEALLRDCIARGADDALLLTDRAFAGADTLATTYALKCGIEALDEDFDLLICGKMAVDGDTAQIGPELAGAFEIPCVTDVSCVQSAGFTTCGSLALVHGCDAGEEAVYLEMPCAMTTAKEIGQLRMPSIAGIRAAEEADVRVVNAADVHADPARCGLAGSPTQVVRSFVPDRDQTCEAVEGKPTEQAAKLAKIIEGMA